MRFGLIGGATVQHGNSADSQGYRDFVDLVVEAEHLGFHSVYLVEHHFSGLGQLSSAFNLLAYLAAKTRSIRLGTGVTVLPWHNPVLVAEQAATLDQLSGGRLEFGVGKGFRDIEFNGFCIPKEEALARYEESVALIKKAWTSTERFSHEGQFWRFHDIIVEPPVVQKPHPPIWSAAGTDESIARVARSGYNLLLDHYATNARLRERLAVWSDTCEAIGRARQPLEFALARTLTITRSKEETEREIASRVDRNLHHARTFGIIPGLNRDEQRAASVAVQDMGNPESALIGPSEEALPGKNLLSPHEAESSSSHRAIRRSVLH